MSVALKGTYLEKMNESIKFCEKSRQRAQDLIAEIRERVTEYEIRAHRRSEIKLTTAQLAVKVDAEVGKDPRFKVAIDNEQWGYRLTQMYAAAETVAAQREIAGLLREQNELLRQHMRLLTDMRELMHQSNESATPNYGSSVPHQRLGT